MRVSIALFSLTLMACPPKKPIEEPGDPVAAAAGDVAAATPIARDPITDCTGEPAWMAWAPCKTNGAVYAVGKAPGTTPLARSTAMNRARAELVRLGLGDKADDGRVTLRGSEAFDSFACKEETHGLVRMAALEITVELTNCDGVLFEPEEDPEASCPVWTRRGAWRVGETVVAVGSVSGLKNRTLATKTARNRAMAEARKVSAVALKVSDDSISTSSVTGPPPGLPTDPEMVECDGVIYTKVTYARPGQP